MNRRRFLQLSVMLPALTRFLASCKRKKTIKGRIVGASAHIGHRLRNMEAQSPVVTENKKVVIIGGGVSGLSAARFLYKQGISDFVVLDLEDRMGGNAANGSNTASAFPWGAHYVPVANNDLTEYLAFLEESGVITGYNEKGLPVYNDYHLCFDPKERLYINGIWQDGLVPEHGVSKAEKEQIAGFLAKMQEFRYAKGSDGKDAFAIPLQHSSKDAELLALDKLTMKEWLLQNGYASGYLHWYVNYCTRDDFGTPYDKVSAWAGIHYYACRKGVGANASHHDVLTWPEGNGWLVNNLMKKLRQQLKNNTLVLSVERGEDSVHITYFDVKENVVKSFVAEQCVMAVPQFIAGRLLKDPRRIAAVQQQFSYVPWMVANLKVKGLEERRGAALSWDNVIYGAESLGYVEATHELVQRHVPVKNLTYYLPLTATSPVEERKRALAKTHEEWTMQVTGELKKVHPNIEEAIEELNVMVWGHAMVQPLPGFIHFSERAGLSNSIYNQVHFAHSDLAGVSLFEEAFYQGIEAAKKVIHNLS